MDLGPYIARPKQKPRQCIRKQRHHVADRGPSSQSYGFSSSHVQMSELDHKEGWALKNWCFLQWYWRMLLRVPWIARRSNQSILKEINPEYSLVRTVAGAEPSVLWPPDANSWFIGKDPDDRKDWRQKEKGTTKDEMVSWHPQFNGHGFEQTLEDSEGQRSLACCSPWGHKE